MITTVTFEPSRIGCPSIPGTMKGIVSSLPGVSDVVIHYDERTLDITFDSEKITPDAIAKKIGQEMGLAMRPKTGASDTTISAADTCPM